MLFVVDRSITARRRRIDELQKMEPTKSVKRELKKEAKALLEALQGEDSDDDELEQ